MGKEKPLMTSTTPNKSRKSISLLETCTKCQAIFQQKDQETHKTQCESEKIDWDWKHNFIQNSILYGSIEISDIPYNKSEDEVINMVFISTEVMQMCNIPLGEPVVLHFKHISVVKFAWASNNKNITSISLLKRAVELDQLEGLLMLQKLTSPTYIADEITLNYTGKHQLPPSDETKIFLKLYNENKIISPKNKITFRYYNRSFNFKIINIECKELKHCRSTDIASQMDKLNIAHDEQIFYKILYMTDFKIKIERSNTDRPRFKYKLDNVGGYQSLIKSINDTIDNNTNQNSKYYNYEINKGILLYGCPGVGKTLIVEAILNERNEHLVITKIVDLCTESFDKAKTILTRQFEEAMLSAPSIIYIEDLDILFRKENNNDHKNKVLLVLVKLLDKIRDFPIAILATTSKLKSIDNLLRKPGKFYEIFEVCTPNPDTRKQIIEKMLIGMKHDLNDKNIAHIAFVTHGFLGEDLKTLCFKAMINMNERTKNVSCNNQNDQNCKVKLEDFISALKVVRPSAMQEVLVEMSNVKWEDIGGQEEIKLKFKQALEWPLKHPEAFERFGIGFPRGVLLYGPPGCSKTMLAKACATESKMNFILVRASELFSKWVGESEKAVREVFRKARQVAPSIIFIDEIETIGRGRTSNNEGSNVDEKVLSLILTELDGVTALGNVTVIGATNRPDKVDEALLRPERFDRIIYVPLPDDKTRKEIFKIKLKKMKLENVEINNLVNKTEGYSGAEIQLVCKEAVLNALTKNIDANKITMDNFYEALSIVKPRISDSLIRIYEEFKV